MDDFGNTYWHYMSPAACIRWHVSQSCYGGAEDWDGYSVPVLQLNSMSKKVYRLENKDGLGPFHGEQVCVPFIKQHADPLFMIELCGLPDELLKALSKAGFIFGWSTLKKYSNFFRKNGKQKCRELGFTMVTYEPLYRFDFPDGQVLFSKTEIDPELINLKTLLDIMSKVSKKKKLTVLN